ncbi:MAG: hypothetical protein QE271_05330 [Bacteriovoracaceae bacterium]|nr:hypothetical protein [Bacteriovoracaceae bacterium]
MKNISSSWDWSKINKELSKFVGYLQKFDRKDILVPLNLEDEKNFFHEMQMKKLLLIMRMRMMEFRFYSDDGLCFKNSIDKLIPQLMSLQYDLTQIDSVFGELITMDEMEDEKELNQYLLNYSQGDPGLEQIFMSKVLWDWSHRDHQKIKSVDEKNWKFEFLYNSTCMNPLEVMINRTQVQLWPQKIIPLQDDAVMVLSDLKGNQWEVIYASKLHTMKPEWKTQKMDLITPYFYPQAQIILNQWLDFTAINEERLVFKFKWNQSKPFELPVPSIPYIHHMSTLKGKNSDHYLSALAVPREELWDWIGSNFQHVEILSPDRWKKIYDSTKTKSNS